MAILRAITSNIDAINEWVGRVSSILLLPLVITVTYEVVARYVFNNPTVWSSELSEFLFGSYALVLGGYALLHGTHIKMDIIYNRFPPRRKAIIDSITVLLFFLFMSVAVWQGWEYALRAVQINEHSRSFWSPPTYHVKLLIPLGFALLLLQGVAKFIRDMVFLIHGEKLS